MRNQDSPEQGANTVVQEPETASPGVENASSPEGETPSEQAAGAGDEWQAKYQEMYDRFLRLTADFDNYKKRTLQEKEDLLKYGSEKTLYEVMPVLDNLERATASLSESSDPKVLYQSFRLVYNQLIDGMGALGLKKIDALGQPFDPNFHEAVSQMESAEYPEGTVAMVMQAGYMLQERVLRPAMVAVSQGAPSNAAAAQAAPEKSENPFKL